MASYTSTGLLRSRDDRQVRANSDRHKLDAINWRQPPRGTRQVVGDRGWIIYTSDRISDACYYVNNAAQVVVISRDTWRTLSYDGVAQTAVMADAIGSASGMHFLDLTDQAFRQAVRTQAQDDVRDRQDVVTYLADQAGALLREAASFAGGGADPHQLRIFFQRLADLQAQAGAVDERMARVHSLIDLAQTAVAEAC